MNDLEGLRVLVAGGGAVGSVTALVLLRCGAKVCLADPAPVGDNASGVAAGMLAPAFETLLDPVSAGHFPLLAASRNLWPELAASLPRGDGLIDRSGALYVPRDEEELLRLSDALGVLDPDSRVLAPRQAQALSPGLGAAGPALFSALDWRLEPRAALASLRLAFEAEGGRLAREAVTGWPQTGFDALVLATGAAALALEVEELRLLSPIKGQILRFAGQAPTSGPVVRGPGVYVAPSAAGAVVGATMQVGRNDREVEPEAVARLKAAASLHFPALAGAQPQAQAGVRAATPDGLPLAGPSAAGGEVMLAAGARRNGWLLAPAIADVIAAWLRGLQAGAFGEAFDPARFASR
jgi:glycine oxidase